MRTTSKRLTTMITCAISTTALILSAAPAQAANSSKASVKATISVDVKKLLASDTTLKQINASEVQAPSGVIYGVAATAARGASKAQIASASADVVYMCADTASICFFRDRDYKGDYVRLPNNSRQIYCGYHYLADWTVRGAGFANQTSSWINYGAEAIKVYQGGRGSTKRVIWLMAKQSTQAYVGTSVNDTADSFAPVRTC